MPIPRYYWVFDACDGIKHSGSEAATLSIK